MSRQILAFLVATVSVTLTGCGGKSPATPPPAIDPVASYRAFLDTDFADLKKQLPDTVFDEGFKFDVQKTDSLVSPLVGSCDIKIASPLVFENGKFEIMNKYQFQLTHGFHDNKWILTSAKGKYLGAVITKDESGNDSNARATKQTDKQLMNIIVIDVDTRERLIKNLTFRRQ